VALVFAYLAISALGVVVFLLIVARGGEGYSPLPRPPELQGYYVKPLHAELCRKTVAASDDGRYEAGVAVWLERSDGETVRLVLGYNEAKELTAQIAVAMEPIEKILGE
jgi:hypothetical protein